MPRPKLEGIYTVRTIWIRDDLLRLCKHRKWNRRQLLEDAILAKVLPEDLAYMESIRLEKELEKNRKILENVKGDIRI